jgi:hypothetical protein
MPVMIFLLLLLATRRASVVVLVLLHTLVAATANTGPQMLQKPITGDACSAIASCLLQTLVVGATKVGRMFYMGRSVRHCSQQPWRKVQLATTVLRSWSGGVGRRWQVLGMRCAGTRETWGNFPPTRGQTWTT